MKVEGNAALEGDKEFLQLATQEFLQKRTVPLTNWGGGILGLSLDPPLYSTEGKLTMADNPPSRFR